MTTENRLSKRPGLLFSLSLAATLLLSGPLTSSLQAQKSVGAWSEIYSGVWYATGSNSSPLQRVYALRMDTRNPWIDFRVTPGNGGAQGQTTRRTTLQFRSDQSAWAAINANYYQVVGSGANIEGLLISGGTLVSGGSSYGHRPAQLRITANRMASLVDSTATPGGVRSAIAGSVWPLLGGSTLGENSEYNPRTGLGLSQDARYIIMVVIDGRQPGYSNGATTRQLGQWLKDFGAWNGMMLDGGGSSTLVAQGAIKNSPSDGSARSVGANFGANVRSVSAGPTSHARNTAMAVDNDGRIWFAGVTDEARVRTRRYDPSSDSWSGMTHHTNSGFGFGVSMNAAPAIVVHPNGDVQLFAVSAAGEMFTRVRSESSGSWGSGWSPDASPVAVRRTDDSISVAAIRFNGTLRHRSWNPSSGWGSFGTHGSEDAWSPYATPCLIPGDDGKLWLFAIGKDQSLQGRYWQSGTGWSGWGAHGANTWSPIGGVVGTTRGGSNANVSIAAVKTDGRLYHRTWSSSSGSWGGFTEHGANADWSISAKPAITQANGRFWIFATKENGTLYHRSKAAAAGIVGLTTVTTGPPTWDRRLLPFLPEGSYGRRPTTRLFSAPGGCCPIRVGRATSTMATVG